jgi:hypothetical protein
MANTPTPFQMSRISIQGGIGAALLIAVLIGAMLAELPVLRAPALTAIAVGIVFGTALIAWRRQRPLDVAQRPTGLSLTPVSGRGRWAPPAAPGPRAR